MKVLVLNGSPKGERSNTYRLTGAFLDGLRQVQQAEVEVLEVGKLHLLPCRIYHTVFCTRREAF